MLIHRIVKPTDTRVQKLLRELNKSLLEVTGDSGESSFSNEDIEAGKGRFILVFLDNIPVACGALRELNSTKCEIKRMFSKSKGAGKFTLKMLESEAKKLGYSEIVLSTRIINKNAVEFYKRNGYSRIELYGKYINSKLSVCLGKKVW